jgi:hypothetical protein
LLLGHDRFSVERVQCSTGVGVLGTPWEIRR